jgi:predicted MFS family arabinose efflux permease
LRRDSQTIYSPDFLWVTLASFFFFASFQLLMVPLPLYIQHIGGTASTVGMVLATCALAAVLVRPLMGRLVDTLGRRPLLLLGIGLFILSPLLFIFATSIPLLMAARALQGVGLAAFTIASTTWIADLVPANRRGEAMSNFASASVLSLAILPVVGSSLLRVTGFPVIFALAAGLALVSVVGASARERHVKAASYGQGHFWTTVRRRGVWLPSLLVLTLGVAYGAIISFIALFARERGLPDGGLFFLAYAVAAIIGRGPLGRLSDRLGHERVIAPLSLLAAGAIGLLAAAHTLPWFLLAGIFYGLTFGTAWPLLNALVVNHASLEGRGAAVGVISTGFDLGVAGGSFLGGLLVAPLGYGGMYVTTAGICLLGVAAFIAGVRTSTET